MRATVATVSPLTVLTPAATKAVPARLPGSPTISLAAGQTVIVLPVEGELVVVARI